MKANSVSLSVNTEGPLVPAAPNETVETGDEVALGGSQTETSGNIGSGDGFNPRQLAWEARTYHWSYARPRIEELESYAGDGAKSRQLPDQLVLATANSATNATQLTGTR